MMTVLITRPPNVAKEAIQLFKEAGIKTYIAPLYEVDYIPIPLNFNFFQYDAVITTSMHAIDVCHQWAMPQDFPLFVVGESSYVYAMANGFTNILYAGQQGVQNLKEYVKILSYKRLVYFQGEIIKEDISSYLRPLGYQVDDIVVYSLLPVQTWDSSILNLIYDKKINGITVFSSQVANYLTEMIYKNNLLDYTSFISLLGFNKPSLKKLENFNWQNIYIASTVQQLIANLKKTQESV